MANSTEELKERFDGHGAFYVYDLSEGDVVGFELGESLQMGLVSRQLLGELVGRNTFRIGSDDNQGEWVERILSFGTYASQFGPVLFSGSGILRGCIIPDGAVSIDHAGKDFFNKGARVEDYPDVYVGLVVNELRIF